MTREQLNKHWKEIEAFKNGAEIECRRLDWLDDTWGVVGVPEWSEYCEYRVKPKAREWWCIVDSDGGPCQTFREKPSADYYKSFHITHVREVIE